MNNKMSWMLALVLAGCAETLRSDPTPGDPDSGSTHIAHLDEGNSVTSTQVEATANDAWIHFDFESRNEMLAGASTWDLGFQRFKIKSNGGVSGTGNVQIAVLPGANFDALTQAPAAGYLSDADDSSDDGSDPDFPFLVNGGWYAYNPVDHTLSPRDVVYVVRTVEGNYFKVKMTGYYDGVGTAGYPSFRWAPVSAPAAEAGITVDASNPNNWVYLRFDEGSASSSDWDVAINRTRFRTNSGTSGSGMGGARKAPAGVAYEDITTSPTFGFIADAMLPNPGPPGSGEFSGSAVLNNWYNYDGATHAVSPKDETFLIRTADGGYGKLKILTYAGAVYTLQLARVERRPTTERMTVSATQAGTWVHVNFRLGETVTVDTPETQLNWDIGFSLTSIKTNGGTSGTGMGAASNALGGEFVVDAMLPIPGPPGSGAFSGNPVLNGWFNYDPVTHAVTPKDTVFFLRTADGGSVKLKVVGYTSGVFELDWTYAGLGHSDFP